MKKIILTVIAAAISYCIAYTQPCLPEGITFTTQEQIDNFQTNYPGCTEIEGDVTINGDDITNLNGLNVLTNISGDFLIGELYSPGPVNPALINLTGLENLTSIGGSLTLRGNSVLSGLNGLENLVYLGGDLRIGGAYVWGPWPGCNGNPSLSSLAGLDNLTTVGGTVEIYCNDLLPDFTGLESLITIEGSLNIGVTIGNQGAIYYFGNQSMTSLTGLDNITSIGENLSIIGNDTLSGLTGLDNLTSIGGDISVIMNNDLSSCEAQIICNYLTSPNGTVSIYNNASGCNNPAEVADACGFSIPCLPFGNYYFFTQSDIDNFQDDYPGCIQLEGDVLISGSDIMNLNGLSVVTSIGGNLMFTGNNLLTSLTGFENLTIIGGDLSFNSWYSWGNPFLNDLTGLNNLTLIGGNLHIFYNDALTSLTGLNNLTSIAGNFHVDDNNSLINFNGLEELNSIGGYLRIFSSNALTSLAGLENLNFIGGSLDIINNDALTSFTGLENLTSTGGTFYISDNDLLTSFNGLENITYIEGTLRIIGNDALTSLTGLENLISINGELEIGVFGNGNSSLTSLAGLENIEAGSISYLTIRGNESLSTCDVNSICDYLSSPNGIAIINNNAPGCNSKLEVEEACAQCLPEGITFSTQAEIDSFQTNYPGCVEIEGDVTINGNDISGLDGIDVITKIHGDLTIVSNDVLTSLTGLANLKSIGGDLLIAGNTVLTILTGLDSIAPGTINDLSIFGNPSLCDCDVLSICQYLSAPNGTIDIHNNAPGCNSQQEVEDACLTDVLVTKYEDVFIIIPNPMESTTLITYTLLHNSPVTLKILDLSGREIATIVDEVQKQGEQKVVFNTAALPAGVYFCVLKTNEGVQTKKMIKL